MTDPWAGELNLASPVGNIRIVDEPDYPLNSPDKSLAYPWPLARAYPWEIDLGTGLFGSRHGVSINDQPVVIIGRCAGGTTVHPHSALVLEDRLLVAVGDHVACFSLQPFELEWSVEVDSATCFGLLYSAAHDALICHGEVAISRLSRQGELLWSEGGRDIFTGSFLLKPDFIEVRDFEDLPYRFAYENGASILT